MTDKKDTEVPEKKGEGSEDGGPRAWYSITLTLGRVIKDAHLKEVVNLKTPFRFSLLIILVLWVLLFSFDMFDWLIETIKTIFD